MPGCPDRRVPTALEGAHHDNDALCAMEQQDQDISSPRVAVAVAATEAPVHDAETSRIRAKYYQCMAKFCSVALLGLAVGLTGIFLYAWVTAFRKGDFTDDLGFISLLFFGTIVCAWTGRRRLATMIEFEEEMFMAGRLEERPKGVPQHVRRTYHYFIFSETDLDADGATSDAGTMTESIVSSNPSSNPALDEVPGVASTGATNAIESEAVSPPRVERGSGGGGEAMAVEPEHDQGNEAPHGTKNQKGLAAFALAPSVSSACSVCLEGYRGGERVCRLPCTHVFHAECIDIWLDQHCVCPHCRLNLLPYYGETTSSDASQLSALSTPDERVPLPPPAPAAAVSAASTPATTDVNGASNSGAETPHGSCPSRPLTPPPESEPVYATSSISAQEATRGATGITTPFAGTPPATVTATTAPNTTTRRSSPTVTTPSPGELGLSHLTPRQAVSPSRTPTGKAEIPNTARPTALPSTKANAPGACLPDSPGTPTRRSATAVADLRLSPHYRGSSARGTADNASPSNSGNDTDTDSFTAVTALNTAINASASGRWVPPAPYARYFADSPCSSSPPSFTSPVGFCQSSDFVQEPTCTTCTNTPPSCAAPYTSWLDSPTLDSPVAFSPSEITAIQYRRSPPAEAPYAHYLDSPLSPSPLPAPGMLNVRLSPEFVKAVPRHGVASVSVDGNGDPRFDMFGSPLRLPPSFKSDASSRRGRGVSPSTDGQDLIGNRHQQRRDPLQPGRARKTSRRGAESTAPPPPPQLAPSWFRLQQPSPTSGSNSNNTRDGISMKRGGGEGGTARLSPHTRSGSPTGWFLLGNAPPSAAGPSGESEWMLSASILNNNGWPTIGSRVRVESLDMEEGDEEVVEEIPSRDAGAAVRARWVWGLDEGYNNQLLREQQQHEWQHQHGIEAKPQHQNGHYQRDRHQLEQARLKQHHIASYDEESRPDAE